MSAAGEAGWTRRRRRRAARAGGGVLVVLGLMALLGGAVLAAAPLWSSWWYAQAQQAAARAFFLARQAASAAPQTAGVASAPPGAAGPTVWARLRIPSIGVDTYVLRGLTLRPAAWQALLRQGPGHLRGSAAPGGPGEAVVFGHVNVWGAVFQHLDKLRPGASIIVETPTESFVYRVAALRRVVPQDVAALGLGRSGPPGLELVTCAGLWDSLRLIVRAQLAELPPEGGTLTVSLAEHALARWLARHPQAPQGRVRAAWSLGDGQVRVLLARSGAAGAAVTAYTLGAGPGGPQVLRWRAVGLAPPLRPAVRRPRAPTAAAGGRLRCGDEVVDWAVGPARPVREHGFTFPARATRVQIQGPGGGRWSLRALPGLADGTYPVACGDLTGDGSTSLVLQTALLPVRAGAAPGAVVQVYRLGVDGPRLTGSMLEEGSGAPPRLVSTGQRGRYAILVPQGGGATQRWVAVDGIWRRVGGGAAGAPLGGGRREAGVGGWIPSGA